MGLGAAPGRMARVRQGWGAVLREAVVGRQVEGCRWEMRRLAVRVQVGAVMSCHPSWGRHPHRALRSARRRWRQRARPVPAFLTCLRLSPPARAADFGLAFPELLQSASGVSRWTVWGHLYLGRSRRRPEWLLRLTFPAPRRVLPARRVPVVTALRWSRGGVCGACGCRPLP